jgi:hypothetical protein
MNTLVSFDKTKWFNTKWIYILVISFTVLGVNHDNFFSWFDGTVEKWRIQKVRWSNIIFYSYSWIEFFFLWTNYSFHEKMNIWIQFIVNFVMCFLIQGVVNLL